MIEKRRARDFFCFCFLLSSEGQGTPARAPPQDFPGVPASLACRGLPASPDRGSSSAKWAWHLP